MDNTVKEELRNYLDSRRDSIVLNTEKTQNQALVILREWDDYEEKIDHLIGISILNLQGKFHNDDKGNLSGMTKLTAAISSIGNIFLTEIYGYPEKTEENWRLACRVGAIFIEMLQEKGFIVVNKDAPDYLGDRGGAPVMIHAEPKWMNMIGIISETIQTSYSGLYFHKPDNIANLFDTVSKKPIVKRNTDAASFSKMLNSTFISGLNAIRKTGWRLNKDVYDIVINTPMETDVPKIPKEGSKKAVEKAFLNLKEQLALKEKGLDNSYDEAQQVFEKESELWAIRKDKLKIRSQIIERQITLVKATGLLNKGIFYNDVEVDYRGRVYYSEAFMNYQGSDLSKSLLEFSEGKKVTVRGYEWMLIHAASCWNVDLSIEELEDISWLEEDYISILKEDRMDNISIDKMSIEDRKRWALANLDNLLEIGSKGLVLDSADKPFMLLAVCIEINKYLTAFHKGEDYCSHLPLPVDGTSNGAQHCAAINRDRQTGDLVGLTNRKVPKDLYVKVGQGIVDKREEFFSDRAMPMRSIRKMISKRATMTRQYSAGRKKIAEAMFSDCYKEGGTKDYNITAQDCNSLAAAAISAIDEICPSNAIVRMFLQDLVKFELGDFGFLDEEGNDVSSYRKQLLKKLYGDDESLSEEDKAQIEDELETFSYSLISGIGSKVITWTTPIGFSVKCELFDKVDTSCRIRISNKYYNLRGHWDNLDRPDINKHISAIAANMIHSLDSTHMLMTADSWHNSKDNGSFGAVHDSFAVHACDVDELVMTLKCKFVELYKGKDMYQYFIDTIVTDTGGLEVHKPKFGTLDLDEVYESNNFFS